MCIVDARAVVRLCEVWSLGEDWDDGLNEVIRVAVVDEEIAEGAMDERIGVSHVEEVIGVVVAGEVLGFDMIGEVIEEKVEVMVGGEVNTVAEVDEVLDVAVQDKVIELGVVKELMDIAVAHMHVAEEEVVVDKVMGAAVEGKVRSVADMHEARGRADDTIEAVQGDEVIGLSVLGKARGGGVIDEVMVDVGISGVVLRLEEVE